MNRNVLVIISLLILGVILYFTLQIWYDDSNTDDDSQSVLVTILPGSDFETILDSLDNAGILGDRLSFSMLAKVTGSDSELKSGTYKFHKGISQAKLLNALKEGHSTIRVKVTFPEGVTIKRIASIASQRAGIDSAKLVRLANDRTFLQSIGLNASTAEGYLMPDTYFFYWGASPDQVLREMSTLFKDFFDQYRKGDKLENGLTPYETIILASLVEGEARVEGDREIVARLYLNRLERGMKLEADPTIQYILPDGPRRLFYKDLRIQSPYNTYQVKGLPPTPINNPGRSSIKASLNPPKHEYLFMVAKGDGSGKHSFSKTKSEHDQAVREYRKSLD